MSAPERNLPNSSVRQKKTVSKSRSKKTRRSPANEPLPQDPRGQKLNELFSNGWDWIYAEAPEKGAIAWETQTTFPLLPIQLWHYHQDPSCFVGVRPKSQTRWMIIDIDRNSPYHPAQDPTGIETIRDALEDIGICRIQINQSSYSGGLHLYCPLAEAVSSFWLAATVKFALETVKINLRSGHCEIFPNPKRYVDFDGF